MTHDQRVTDLLNANNAELELRRALEAELAATRALLEAAGRELTLAKRRSDGHADTLRAIARMHPDKEGERMRHWALDSLSGYVEPIESTVKTLSDERNDLRAQLAEAQARAAMYRDALERHRQGCRNILEFRKLTNGRYGMLTGQEVEEVIAEIDTALADEPSPGDPLQLRIDAETKPLHVEIERLREALEHIARMVCWQTVLEQPLKSDCKCFSCSARAALADAPTDPPKSPDLIDLLHRKNAWSLATFGPGQRTIGITKHIEKELQEIRQDPTDLMEWVDVILLAADGYWRAGGTPEELLRDLHAKQERNFSRTYPRTPEDQPSEHDRSGE